MKEKKLQELGVAEQERISELIIRIIAEFPDLPDGIVPQFQALKEEESLGIFTLQGTAYLKKDILGGFKAQYPFMLIYRTMPSNNEQRIQSQEILDNLAKWLEQVRTPGLTDGRVIESLERTTTTTLHASYDSGVQDYKCNMNLKYRKD